MSLSPLSSSIINLINTEPVASTVKTDSEHAGDFSDILTEAFKTAEVTDEVDKGTTIELLTGQSDDMSGLLLDAQKAEISLNLALQIRNKCLDAYNEIMRMQV